MNEVTEDEVILEEDLIIEEEIEEIPLLEEPIEEEPLEEFTPAELEALRLEKERLEAIRLEEERLEAECIARDAQIEADRLAALEREQDLKSRYKALWDSNMACHQSGISNPDLYFNQQILFLTDKAQADKNMEELEAKDVENKAIHDSEAWLQGRQTEYALLDKDFIEAIVEKEEGRPDKLEIYLEKRKAIKIKYPKV